MVDTGRLARYADLLLRVGVNLQPGQQLLVVAEADHARMVRVLAERAWLAGASSFWVEYRDAFLKRPLVDHGPEAALSATDPGAMARLEAVVAARGAVVQLIGDPAPDLLAGADPARSGRAFPVDYQRVIGQAVSDRAISWTAGGYPVEGWARQMFGEADVESLWRAIERALRLDHGDPVAAWRRRLTELEGIARALNERGFDALHYRGPGTDLRVGLLPSGRWVSAAGQQTVWGQAHVANLPTEEVFTTPDRRRAEGTVRATRPLALAGSVIEGLEFTFRGGRITDVRAHGQGAETVRARLSVDAGAAHLGELALVDADSVVGQLGLTFWHSLFDENAASHLAFGRGFAFCVEAEEDRRDGANQSITHVDFMVGGAEVEIDGIEPGGAAVPVLRENRFQPL